MRYVILYCPSCRKLLGELHLNADGYGLTLPCSNCHTEPIFTSSLATKKDEACNPSLSETAKESRKAALKIYECLDEALKERDEAQSWAVEFKRIAGAIWDGDWEGEDIDKLWEEWPTLPDWLKKKATDDH